MAIYVIFFFSTVTIFNFRDLNSFLTFFSKESSEVSFCWRLSFSGYNLSFFLLWLQSKDFQSDDAFFLSGVQLEKGGHFFISLFFDFFFDCGQKKSY
jgi:hypothetical protein